MAITEEMIYGSSQSERPDLPSSYGPTVRNLLTLSSGIKPDMDTEELMRLANSIEQGKRNLTMSARLQAYGGDPEAAMKPATDKPEDTSMIAKLLGVLDVAGAPVRYGLGKVSGMPLYNKSVYGGDGKSKVGFSDIIRYFQDTALGGAKDTWGQKWSRGVGGFAGDVATDPVTWLTFGAGAGPKIGGKVLSKAGRDILKKAAPAFNAATDKKAAMEVINAALEQAAGKGEKVYANTGTRLFGQKIGPDPFSALGKGIKSGYSTLKDFSNPVNTETMTLARKLAGKAVSGIEDIGSAISTKYGLPKEYLAMRRLFEDQLNSANLTIKDELKTIFTKADGKLANKKERIAITKYIDDPKNFSITPDLMPVAGNVKKKFAELAKELQEKGLLENTRQDYIKRIIGDNAPRYLKSKKDVSGRLSTSLGGSQKERYYGTISELFEAQPGLKSLTEMDAAKSLGKYWATAEKSKATKDFLDGVQSLSQTGEGVLKTPYQERFAGEMADFTPKGGGQTIKDVSVNISKDLSRIDDPKYAKGFWGYRTAHNAWKQMVTVVNPGFHARNAFSNQVLSSLDVGKEMLNPKLYWDVGKIMTGGKGKITNRYGMEYTYDEIRNLMKENGVIKAGWGKNENKMPSGLPATLEKFNFLNWGSIVGNKVENEGRITNFLAHLYKGDSALEAAQGVDKALFNYADLTNADRAIKWVVPFYTFSKKHAELMGKTLLTNPGRVTAEIRLGKNVGEAILGGKEVSQEDMRALPDFYKEGLKIARSVGEEDAIQILSGIGLPIEDMENYPVFSGWRRFGEKTIGRTSPVIKLPLEMVADRDFFFGAPLSPGGMIKRPDGTTVVAYTKSYPFMKHMPEAVKTFLEFEELPGKDGKPRYTINNLKLKELEIYALGLAGAIPQLGTPFVFSRLYRDIGKLTDTSKPWTPRLYDYLTGVRKYELEGSADLKTRAAASQTSQLGNLLSASLAKQKKKAGIP